MNPKKGQHISGQDSCGHLCDLREKKDVQKTDNFEKIVKKDTENQYLCLRISLI
jgi:hypothetical protein